jgi:hypothetical protein
VVRVNPGSDASLAAAQAPATAKSVTPFNVYEALVGAGASMIQAIGIMANMLNESDLNPEATSTAPAYGLVQWEPSSYPGAASLVTGNAAADLKAQVTYLAQTGGFTAASGATGADAAASFAATYERCATCTPGGSQYNSRVANAKTVLSWITGGSWPTSAKGNSTGGGGSSSCQVQDCMWGCIPSVSIPLAGEIWAGECVFTYSTARHLIGAGVVVGGLLIIGWGGSLLVALAVHKAAQEAIGFVTGTQKQAKQAQGAAGTVKGWLGGGGSGAAAEGGEAAAGAGGAAEAAELAPLAAVAAV